MSDGRPPLSFPMHAAKARPAPSHVSRRIDVPCEALGFAPPPCSVDLRFLSVEDPFVMVAMMPPGKAERVAKWLAPYGPAVVQPDEGVAPKSLRAEFVDLPEAWRWLATGAHVKHLAMSECGIASIFVEDARERVDRFVQDALPPEAATRVRKALAGPRSARLTVRQAEMLCRAVALGYYELPHQLNLRQLAARMGLSVGAAAELLRRGESLVIKSFVDSLIMSRWDESGQPSPIEPRARRAVPLEVEQAVPRPRASDWAAQGLTGHSRLRREAGMAGMGTDALGAFEDDAETDCAHEDGDDLPEGHVCNRHTRRLGARAWRI